MIDPRYDIITVDVRTNRQHERVRSCWHLIIAGSSYVWRKNSTEGWTTRCCQILICASEDQRAVTISWLSAARITAAVERNYEIQWPLARRTRGSRPILFWGRTDLRAEMTDHERRWSLNENKLRIAKILRIWNWRHGSFVFFKQFTKYLGLKNWLCQRLTILSRNKKIFC